MLEVQIPPGFDGLIFFRDVLNIDPDILKQSQYVYVIGNMLHIDGTQVDITQEQLDAAMVTYNEHHHIKALMVPIRKIRNEELAKSDWTQMPDSPLSEVQKTNWAMWRQQLRELPNSFNDVESAQLALNTLLENKPG